MDGIISLGDGIFLRTLFADKDVAKMQILRKRKIVDLTIDIKRGSVVHEQSVPSPTITSEPILIQSRIFWKKCRRGHDATGTMYWQNTVGGKLHGVYQTGFNPFSIAGAQEEEITYVGYRKDAERGIGPLARYRGETLEWNYFLDYKTKFPSWKSGFRQYESVSAFPYHIACNRSGTFSSFTFSDLTVFLNEKGDCCNKVSISEVINDVENVVRENASCEILHADENEYEIDASIQSDALPMPLSFNTLKCIGSTNEFYVSSVREILLWFTLKGHLAHSLVLGSKVSPGTAFGSVTDISSSHDGRKLLVTICRESVALVEDGRVAAYFPIDTLASGGAIVDGSGRSIVIYDLRTFYVRIFEASTRKEMKSFLFDESVCKVIQPFKGAIAIQKRGELLLIVPKCLES